MYVEYSERGRGLQERRASFETDGEDRPPTLSACVPNTLGPDPVARRDIGTFSVFSMRSVPPLSHKAAFAPEHRGRIQAETQRSITL
jgi:hypothetical protein